MDCTLAPKGLTLVRGGGPLACLVRSARRITAHVAQSVEHLHGKQKVSGSIPLVGSIFRIALIGSSGRTS